MTTTEKAKKALHAGAMLLFTICILILLWTVAAQKQALNIHKKHDDANFKAMFLMCDHNDMTAEKGNMLKMIYENNPTEFREWLLEYSNHNK